MARITETTDTIEYDGTTGEVTRQTSTKTTNWGAEPDYIKIYLQDVLYLKDMSSQYASAVLSLLKRATYAGENHGMCIVLAPLIRDDICAELGLKNRQSLSNILRKLVQGEILYSVGRNVYRLNPYLFGKGTWADIAKIRMEVTYIPGQGRTFKSVIEKAATAKRPIQAMHQDPEQEQLPGFQDELPAPEHLVEDDEGETAPAYAEAV